AMSLSSFCVVSNALRLNLFRIRDPKPFVRKKGKIVKKEKTEMKKMIKIEGMMCPRCEAHVKKALEALDEVKEAIVSHQTGTAEVTLNAPISDDTLKMAVEEEEYTVLSVENV
ncbi:MAG: cation transporter, partial [Clostridia bacterium]|nr:cation transporter [Clostridia bacterium]